MAHLDLEDGRMRRKKKGEEEEGGILTQETINICHICMYYILNIIYITFIYIK